MRPTWDIFCSVVDNYGDIGVTWRLARQLVAEHGLAVRLWVDDLSAFARLCPQADVAALRQHQQGAEVCWWGDDWQAVEPADVVIEAFACELPASYIAAMARRAQKPLWLNLEYLSAEEWVEGCHGLPSLQSNGLSKFFFFPGFTAGSGGLLRERDLLEQRRAFQADSGAREVFLRSIGVMPLPGARLISLFAYENAALASWLDVLAADIQINQLLVPEGRILQHLQTWLGCSALRTGDMQQRGQLHIQVLPFIQQDQYDRLLWSCDFNAVRGEDSFVRAQWAGRPLLWHIYQQADDIHLEKLDAFLVHYKAGLSADGQPALVELWHAWNTGQSVKESWNELLQSWPEQQTHAEQWCLQRASQADLAEALVKFYLNWL
ncbi:MAG: elongation factor P maturation arginine rhamnosyltransferase EarP [Pseudomonas sp.]|uniref:elongation factor P maturation arginine rhamnosyltransferase EarP n=1 Tax=Pseudomonas sp. FEMGT703P TaxID=2080764 RepID=UPI000CB2E670|nr:elongation factor P maturation arginine rhamnosyltransferase EarP [Pseudomonas sp. FEMGT703P]PJE39752.1 MAG: elongation factor P maturation arginine rhamnosyltransferase EarP [Pseudomonas sp.] [Pseudomonas sp. FEMGT703P]